MMKANIRVNERSFYITVRDPKKAKSKTITVRGNGLTVASVIRFVAAAIDQQKRKGS